MSDYPIEIGDHVYRALCTMVDASCDEDAPLTSTDHTTLEYVRRHPNEETARIAAAFGIKRSAMHTRLGRLAKRALVVARYEGAKRGSTGGKIARWRAR